MKMLFITVYTGLLSKSAAVKYTLKNSVDECKRDEAEAMTRPALCSSSV